MFDNVVGQETVKKTLGAMVESDRLPHALLFAGPYGTGKAETAFELARMLLCGRGPVVACGECGACLRTARQEHPDLHVLFPSKAPPEKSGEYDAWLEGIMETRKRLAGEPYNTLTFEKGRQIVTALVNEVHDRLMESSFEGGGKVCVIVGAEHLNDRTANSLLKILEEPPSGVTFILTAERLSSVLPTIVSRTSIVRFRRLRTDEIESFLARRGVDDPSARTRIAVEASGSLKCALERAFGDAGERLERAREMYAAAVRNGPDVIPDCTMPYLRSRDIAAVEELVEGFAHCTRAVLARTTAAAGSGTGGDDIAFLAARSGIGRLHTLSAKIEESMEMLGRNTNPSLVLTTLLYEIYDAYKQ